MFSMYKFSHIGMNVLDNLWINDTAVHVYLEYTRCFQALQVLTRLVFQQDDLDMYKLSQILLLLCMLFLNLMSVIQVTS